MKRQPSTSIPVLPPSPRRKRALSEEERALWDTVAKEIRPLRKKPRAGKTDVASAQMEPTAAAKAAVPPNPLPLAKIPRATKPITPPLAPLGRRERAQLSRGRKEIDARLDLHGMTPTRGIRVTIQPKSVILGSFVEISRTSFEPGKVFTACKIRNRQTAQFEIHRE